MKKKLNIAFFLLLSATSLTMQAMDFNSSDTQSLHSGLEEDCECEECEFITWPKRKTSLSSPREAAKLKIRQELKENKEKQQKILDKLKASPRSSSGGGDSGCQAQNGLVAYLNKQK